MNECQSVSESFWRTIGRVRSIIRIQVLWYNEIIAYAFLIGEEALMFGRKKHDESNGLDGLLQMNEDQLKSMLGEIGNKIQKRLRSYSFWSSSFGEFLSTLIFFISAIIIEIVLSFIFSPIINESNYFLLLFVLFPILATIVSVPIMGLFCTTYRWDYDKIRHTTFENDSMEELWRLVEPSFSMDDSTIEDPIKSINMKDLVDQSLEMMSYQDEYGINDEEFNDEEEFILDMGTLAEIDDLDSSLKVKYIKSLLPIFMFVKNTREVDQKVLDKLIDDSGIKETVHGILDDVKNEAKLQEERHAKTVNEANTEAYKKIMGAINDSKQAKDRLMANNDYKRIVDVNRRINEKKNSLQDAVLQS